MSGKIKKQFGVWMDTQHAIIVGRENENLDNYIILGHEKSESHGVYSSENTTNNAERNALHKFFKDITSHMQNVEEIHVTGTGTAQEQFIHYLKETPHYKNVIATESTSNKMSDEALIEYFSAQFK